MRYDLTVIGNGKTAHTGALAAARLGKRVALIEGAEFAPGRLTRGRGRVALRTVRRALAKLAGGGGSLPSGSVLADLRRQVEQLQHRARVAAFDELDELGVDVYRGQAVFAGPHDVRVESEAGAAALTSDFFLLACGSRPERRTWIPFDGRRVIDSDDVLWVESVPDTLVIAGAGDTGCEAARLFAELGSRVTLVDGRELPAGTAETDVGLSAIEAQRLGIIIRRGADVIAIERLNEAGVAICLQRGDRLLAAAALFAGGRIAETAELNLAAAGLTADERGRLWCDDQQRTWTPHILVAGDAAGYPARDGATDPVEQAVAAAFGRTAPERRLGARDRRLEGVAPRVTALRGAPRASAACPLAAGPRN